MRAARRACEALARHHLVGEAEVFFQHYLQADARVNPPHISHISSDARIIAKAEELARLTSDTRRAGFFLHAYRDALREFIQPSQALLDLFTALARAGIRRGIISDGSIAGQTEVLYRLGLLLHVSPGLCFISEEVGSAKAEPEIYRRALAAARIVEPARALMIGDHFEYDVAVPQSLGMKAAWLRAHKPPAFISQNLSATRPVVSPDYRFDTWEELFVWFANLVNSSQKFPSQ